ncbi:flagellar hook-associated protein FlgK [Ferrovibrio sp.]|uniref:flagellar hook-associated protein FlgK n=1 Tax=Ferrovibrio sp. TaxID=1917215 RepID=UPI000CAAB866|nr:flagellar hook-associated protein FlgK [Ferrovibrio sp.]PJI42405.1 MAG: flagellar hook-associated protein FlgK [Ferrovibrio sp.]
MSLSAALNTAVIGLQTLQSQTRIAAGNVSNAQNPNYTRKVATLTTPTADGLPQAALVSSVTRAVAPEIQQDFFTANADYGRLDMQLGYSKELAEALDATNTTGDQPTILAMMTRFEDAWKQLEATPENNDLKSLVVQRGSELASEIRRLNGLQSELQNRAQQNVQTDIEAINTATAKVAELNGKIASLKAAGTPVGDLEDLRDAEIKRLSDKVGIRTLENDRGETFVYTEGGVQLVGTTAQKFEYVETANPPAYPQAGIYLQGSSTDVTGGFLNGSTRASLDYLDVTASALASTDPNVGSLSKFFNQLDTFAANLADVVNTAYGGVFFDYSAPVGTPPDEAGLLVVEAGVVADPSTLDATVAGTVQQAMRNTTMNNAQINRSTDPNGLVVANVNIFGIANSILSYQARAAADNELQRDTSERLQHTLDQKFRNITGVNIDDELAQLQLLQNNYAALANVMNTITQMFDTLVNIGR